MEMRKCAAGHYYDASMYSCCPYCGMQRNTEVTVAQGMSTPLQSASVSGSFGGTDKTVALGMANSQMIEMPMYNQEVAPKIDLDDNKTIAILQSENGVDPVVGWLVQMDGKNKGKDYRIHSDNNYIGRGEQMDVRIKGDDTISRENQAIITYDNKEKKYYFSPGEGRSVIRLNGKAIFQTSELKAYDKVTIGQTELVFVPFCRNDFSWQE